jgi:GTP-binding protein YchF
VESLRKVMALLDQGKPARSALPQFTAADAETIRPLNLLTSKPVMYVANVSESQAAKGQGPYVDVVRKIAQSEQAVVVPICGSIESQIAALETDQERAEFLAAEGLSEPGLHRLIRAGYDLLGLITFFTVGEKEDRAWTIRRGSTAPQAAGKIHSDMERGFIRAEVIGYDDFLACKSEAAARETGKLRVEGKEYVVRDGDLMHFRFSV